MEKSALERELAVALELVRQAGLILLESVEQGVEMELKGEIDPVTAVDRRVERFLVAGLAREFPDHGFLAEEEGGRAGGSDFRWVIDPIDGTTNFAHGYPCFTVSVALERQGEAVLGVVHQPVTRELFQVTRGEGASRNGRRLRVSGQTALERSFLVTGFPYNLREPGVLERNLERFHALLGRSFAVRRDGSAAYDLACVAAGRFDAFWEENLSPWDTSAGVLMVREAGGLATDFQGLPYDPHESKTLLAAGTKELHGKMLELLA